MKITTFADAVGVMAREGLAHRRVAEQMGYSPAEFSHVIRDRYGRPSAAWSRNFQNAIAVLTREAGGE